MRITVLAGGIGAARFLRGLLAAAPDATITVIGNTADDITLFGLRVCPDLDSVMYTLGGGSNEEQGWGRAGESHRIGDELAAYGAGPAWFTLGDLDFATHIRRSQLLAEGKPLSEVTRLLCERWQPGVRLLPMSDDRVETQVRSRMFERDGAPVRMIHFQEWWVRLHAAVPAEAITPVGADTAAPAPGVLEAIADADFVLFPPSNPVVSIGPILAVPGIRAAVAAKTVVGRLRDHRRRPGPRHGRRLPGRDRRGDHRRRRRRALRARAHQRLARRRAGQGRRVDDPALAGIAVRALPLYMRDVPSSAAIAQAAIDLAKELTR